jgi:hypothetical protein
LDNQRFKAEGLAHRAWLHNLFRVEWLSDLHPKAVPWATMPLRFQRAENTASVKVDELGREAAKTRISTFSSSLLK